MGVRDLEVVRAAEIWLDKVLWEDMLPSEGRCCVGDRYEAGLKSLSSLKNQILGSILRFRE